MNPWNRRESLAKIIPCLDEGILFCCCIHIKPMTNRNNPQTHYALKRICAHEHIILPLYFACISCYRIINFLETESPFSLRRQKYIPGLKLLKV